MQYLPPRRLARRGPSRGETKLGVSGDCSQGVSWCRREALLKKRQDLVVGEVILAMAGPTMEAFGEVNLGLNLLYPQGCHCIVLVAD